ncbi:hypothetical protein FQR65_LT10095 [Abscondita terminalis]|nr:hypothetical protein FQR65_LT10095 [Abscondita terminalis]
MDFHEFIDYIYDNPCNYPEHRYLRDAENPMEFYNSAEFQRRFRFRKETVINKLLPFLFEGENNSDLIKSIGEQNRISRSTPDATDDIKKLIIQTGINVANNDEKAVVVRLDIDSITFLIALCPAEKDIPFLKDPQKKDV